MDAKLEADVKDVLPQKQKGGSGKAGVNVTQRLEAKFDKIPDGNQRCFFANVTERCALSAAKDREGADLKVWLDFSREALKARDNQCKELATSANDAAERAKLPPVTAPLSRTVTVIAYTNTDYPQPWVDEKSINIPAGWNYSSHLVRETTGLNQRRITERVERDPTNPSRIIAVYVRVEAFGQLFARSWVGAELAVSMTQP